MHLKSLKIKGFKSFGKSVTINFTRGLSAIVGPNGTGKSNIVDAVLWVLGEQNPRLLRGQSMQDIIFAGTEKLKPSPYAEVTLVFDNSDGSFPFEHSEISIKRILTRDGISTYYLNERPCRLLDVRDAISHLNLGLELPGIVPQNRVYELINPNSSDLRAIIEEASGVGFYRMRREQAVKRLASAEDSLEKIRILKEEIGRQLKPLKKQVEDYKKIIKLKEELSELSLQKKVLTLRRLKETFEKNFEEIEFLKNEEMAVSVEIEDTSKKQVLLEKKKEENSALLVKTEKLKKARDSISNLKFLKMLIEEKGKHYLDKLSSLSNQTSFLNVKIQEEISKLNQLKKELTFIEAKRDETIRNMEKYASEQKIESENLKKLLKEQSNIEKEHLEIKRQLEKTSKEILEFESKIKTLEELEDRYKKELENYTVEVKKMESEISNIKADINELNTVKSSQTLELKKLADNLNRQKSLYEEKEKMLKSIEFELFRKKQELSEVEAEIEKAKKQQRNVFDEIEPKKEIIDVLSKFIPFGLPLAYVYEEEIIVESNLPECFVVVKKGNEKQAIMSVIEKLKNESRNTISINGFSRHPSGFYYKTTAPANFYSLISRKEELSKELNKLSEKMSNLRKEVDELEKAKTFLENQIKELETKLRDIESLLQKKTSEISVIQNKYSFYLSEIEKKKNEREKIKDELVELRKKIKELYGHLNNLDEKATFIEKNFEKIRRETKEAKERLSRYQTQLRISEDDIKRIESRREEISNEISRLEKSINENKTNTIRLEQSSKAIEQIIGRINEVYRIISNIIETANIIFAVKGDQKNFEDFLTMYNREMTGLMEKLRNLYERKSKIAARKEILENQLSEVEKKIANLVQEIENEAQKPIDQVLELTEIHLKEEEIDERMQKIKSQLEAIGEYNPFAVRDYEILKSKLDDLNKQSQDIKSAIANINTIISEVDRRIEARFLSSVSTLNENLQEIFRYMIGGGNAFLEIENSNTDNNYKLNLKIELPGKKLQSVSLLSGGEKSLAALSLILAMEKSFNIPFLLLDEVEPALDELNLKRLIKYLKEISAKTQIIMVTHQPLTVENSDVLYGVSIDADGCSQVYSLKISEEVLNDS